MLVLFRNGDFYELFEDDANLGSTACSASRSPSATARSRWPGCRSTSSNTTSALLLRAGHRVAVCEQMEEPDPKKKIIHREVNRVVTPGTVTDDGLLDPRAPNHLVAIVPGKGSTFGLAWVDLSTGSFAAADVPAARLPDELARLNAGRVPLRRNARRPRSRTAAGAHLPKSRTARPDWTFDPATALAALKKHFRSARSPASGSRTMQPCLVAAGAVIIYLQETLKASLAHIRRLQPHRPDALLTLDEVTRRSLELTRTLRDNQRDGSLLSVLDRTVTPDGVAAAARQRARPAHGCIGDQRPARRGRGIAEGPQAAGQRPRACSKPAPTSSGSRRASRRPGRAPRTSPRSPARSASFPAVKAKLAGRRSALLQDLERPARTLPRRPRIARQVARR